MTDKVLGKDMPRRLRGDTPNKTYVVFILDETGSMLDCKKETISGFNEYIAALKREQNVNYFFGLTKFNSEQGVRVVYPPKEVRLVDELDADNYQPNHMTPLLDAVGKSVNATKESLKDESDPHQVLCVIMTDGQENASREFKIEGIKKMVEELRAQNWEFVFLGANMDAWATGMQFGFGRQMVASFNNQNMRGAYAQALYAAETYSRSGSVNMSEYTPDKWESKLSDEDAEDAKDKDD